MTAACSDRAPNMGTPDARSPTAITITTIAKDRRSNIPENVQLLAFQDGDGPWTALPGTAGVYHASATDQRYAVAVGCVDRYGSSVDVLYQTITDGTELQLTVCAASRPTAHVSVHALGVVAEERVDAYVGNTMISVSGDGLGEDDVPKGVVDVFARLGPRDGTRKLYRGSTVDLAADQMLEIDLTTALAPESHPLAVVDTKTAEATTEIYRVHSSYATRNTVGNWPLNTTPDSDTLADQYVTFDARQRQPGELSNILVSADGTLPDHRTFSRYAKLALATPGAATVELPPLLRVSAPTISQTAPRGTARLSIHSGSLGHAESWVSFQTSNDDFSIQQYWSLSATPSWAQGQSEVTLETPDLRALPGWLDELALRSGAPTLWTIGEQHHNLLNDYFPVDGRRSMVSYVTGTIAP